MKIKHSVVILITVICLAGMESARGQDNRSALGDRLVTLKTENQAIRLIFYYLMKNHDVRIGFEQSDLDRNYFDYFFQTNPNGSKVTLGADGVLRMDPKLRDVRGPKTHPISVDLTNEKLEAVLDRIVQQMENYRWEINEGVVNIYPNKGRNERFEKLLNLKIKYFTLEKNQTVMDITPAIRQLPEVSEFLRANNMFLTVVRSGSSGEIESQYGRALGEKMEFSDLSLRDLLNKITVIKGGGWLLKWKPTVSSSGRDYIDIDI